MKWIKSLKNRLKGVTDAITRFPLTTLFLLAAVTMNAYDIQAGKSILSKYLLTFLVGAFLSAVFQVVYERFFTKISSRFMLKCGAVLLTAGYYLLIRPAPRLSMEIEIRTAVALFALLIAFIWVPVIKSKINFNKSFMISFKSLFISGFFAGVIFAGISLILQAIHILIFIINDTAYQQTANIVFILFTPMYFLSLIPVYFGTAEQNKAAELVDSKKEILERAAHCPRFLEILISYIVIPLIAVFTLILVIYIIQNISGEFWTDNLLEPMLVSYSITVLLVYILASEIENKFTALFRMIFPKVLVPIVIFQIIASIISLADTGVTHTRYYVILFGLFAAVSGVLLSFLPVKKNGVIAALLIVFAAVSIIPPLDAFTISRNSQTDTLKEVLEKNNMLENGNIKPNGTIPDKDKQTITIAVDYLRMMEYTDKIEWLPEELDNYSDFKNTFGFEEYYKQVKSTGPVSLSLEPSTPIYTKDYDAFVQFDIFLNEKNRDDKICNFNKAEKNYTLLKDFNKDDIILKLIDENESEELISFNTKEIYDKYGNFQKNPGIVSAEQATTIKENEKAKIAIIIQNVYIDNQNNNALLYVLIQIK